jgi:hypothetical protein
MRAWWVSGSLTTWDSDGYEKPCHPASLVRIYLANSVTCLAPLSGKQNSGR